MLIDELATIKVENRAIFTTATAHLPFPYH